MGIFPNSSELTAYISDQHIEFPVLALTAQAEIVAELGATPTTFLVNPKGVIEKMWVGAYVDSARLEIERYFHLSLPHVGLDAQRRTAVPVRATERRR